MILKITIAHLQTTYQYFIMGLINRDLLQHLMI